MNYELEDIYQRHLDLWKSHERDYGLRIFVMGAMKEYAELKMKQLQDKYETNAKSDGRANL